MGVLGTRMGTASLALATVLAVAAPSIAADGDGRVDGSLGAVHPDLLADVGASAPGRSADTVTAESGFTWADRPYELATGDSASLVGADRWHRQGRAGEGVTVAIVDLGFSGYRSLLGTDLPDEVKAISFRSDGSISGGTSHGTAAAEIVHAVAPDADILLIAFDGDLFEVVQYLIDQEVDVVSFSVGYLSGPFDGSSPASRAVKWAVDSGIVWVTAAGNFADKHWGGKPKDRDGDGWLNFTRKDEINAFTVKPGSEFHLYLNWVGGGDLDLCLYRLPATVNDPLACASGVQGTSGRGLEVARWRNDSAHSATFGFSIRQRSGSPKRVDVIGWQIEDIEHGTSTGSVIAPGDVASAITVGAVWWSNPNAVLPSSGRGPTAAGTRKPDVVAPTGLGTTSWGAFGGTSGAAPHVAGVVTLLREAYPSTTVGGMRVLLRRRADALSGVAAGAGLSSVGSLTPACAGFAPTIVGTNAADEIVGTARRDVIVGLGGDDIIHGGRGHDIVCGGRGDDLIIGQSGNDYLDGERGNDQLQGGSGKDRIFGSGGRDRLWGGRGNDLLDGGPGRDRCSSGVSTGCE